MENLNGRVAFVTGAGSGIGRGIALALAREGMAVAVADISEANAAGVAAEVRELGAPALGLACDVTDPASLADGAAAAQSQLGRVRLLSNNAGTSIPQGPLSQKTREDWDWGFSVNLFGIVNCVQTFVPLMRETLQREQGEAHIVNTASMAALLVLPDLQVGVYTAAKHACLAYTEGLRAELASDGIGVSVLCPGLVDTPLASTSARHRPERFGGPFELEGGMPEEMRAAAMRPEEVGPIVVRGVRENRLHILTHPEVRPLLQARFDALMRDCDAEEARVRGE